MKKLISTMVMSAFIAVGGLVMTSEANAQSKRFDNHGQRVSQVARSKNKRNDRRYQENRQYNSRYGNNGYYNNGYYGVKQPNVYDRHRKAINLSVGTGAGAAIGAAVGGTKGALIGAAAGLATGAIVTKVQKPRNYPKYVRRN